MGTKQANVIVNAFLNGMTKTINKDYTNGIVLKLYGHTIAKKENGRLFVSIAGWNTNTTRSRLNCIPFCNVKVKQGQLFLNGEKWEGSFKEVR